MKLAKTLVAASAVAALLATQGLAQETKGPVTDEIGVVQIREGDPIQIGGYWVLSGPDTALGLDQQRGVEVYFEQQDNQVAGHPIKLIVEDTQCNAEGGQTAATKLAANENIVAVVGPACSSAATPGAPILWNAGMPSIGTSTTAPALTDPERKEGLHGFLRSIYNDLEQGAGDAEYFFNEVGCKKLATVHDGSPYAEQLVRVAEDRFRELGGEVVAAEAVAPTDVDMRPLLTGIATKEPCVVYYPIFVAAAAQITRQISEISGLENAEAFGGGSLMSPGFLEAAGDAAVGFKITFPDTSEEGRGATYPEFVKAYNEMFGENPINAFHSNAYDGARMLHEAIEKVAKKGDDGSTYIGRKALRDALFNTEPFDGASGPIECNEHGDCGKFSFSVWEFVDGDPASFEIGENPKKIYPTE